MRRSGCPAAMVTLALHTMLLVLLGAASAAIAAALPVVAAKGLTALRCALRVSISPSVASTQQTDNFLPMRGVFLRGFERRAARAFKNPRVGGSIDM